MLRVRSFAGRASVGASVSSAVAWPSSRSAARCVLHTASAVRPTAAAAAASAIAAARQAATSGHMTQTTPGQTRTQSAPAAAPTRSRIAARSSLPAPPAASSAPADAGDQPAADAPFTSSLPAGMADALAAQGITQPTAIQSAALPVLLSKRHVLLASHTGSGKTLAYLLPLLVNLRRDEDAGILARLNRPRAVILVPNRELAIQILSVAKSLSGAKAGRFRSLASTGFIPLRKLTRALESPVDLLVVTPGRLEFLLSSNRISLTDTRYVVLDETDTLLAEDQGFRDGVERTVLQGMRHRISEAEKKRASEGETTPAANPAPPVQLTFCSASISPAIESYIRQAVPGVIRVHTPSLHHLPADLLIRNILVKGEDKKDVLWELLQKESASYKQRLMHHRTREQNQAELAACGGDEAKWWEEVVRQDVEKRFGLAPATAAEIQIRNQLRYEEDAQDEAQVVTEVMAKTAQLVEDIEDRSDPDHPFHHQDATDAASAATPTNAIQLPLPPTLIFCNTVSCCRAVAWYLTNLGLNVGHYHGLMPAHYRTMHFKNFLAGHTSILVCTDLASRGLDTTFVQHTIHFDFPMQVLDFLHRVGRTARNGRKGKSTALLGKRDRVMADAIDRLSKLGLSIEQISADKSKYGSDGLPLSRELPPASRPPSAAAMSGPKLLTPTRGTAPVTATGRPKSEPMQKGEVPRRRWMRYLSPSQRNEHKLLYSYKPPRAMGEKAPTAKQLRRMEEREAEYPTKATTKKANGRGDSRAVTSETAGGEPTRVDPFAFSAPPQFRQQQAAHTKKKDPNVRDALNQPTRFPSAATAGRRPAISRPLGPLAHKQRVGAIFAKPEEPKTTRPSPSGAKAQKASAASAKPDTSTSGGRSTTSGAFKKRQALAKMERKPTEFEGNRDSRWKQARAANSKAQPGKAQERARNRKNGARKEY